MKIKIVEDGFKTYTGPMGFVMFENGVSVGDVSNVEVNRLSALIRIVNADGDSEVGSLVHAVAGWDKSVEPTYYLTEADIQAGVEVPQPEGEPQKPKASEPARAYTSDELEAIADKGGIAALRVIADERNIKGTSIVKLVEAIIASQTPAPIKEEA